MIQIPEVFWKLFVLDERHYGSRIVYVCVLVVNLNLRLESTELGMLLSVKLKFQGVFRVTD